ncbi:SNF2 family N-terminal domain-containing protein [Lasiosphaeria hispida]|uniref:SNF2 family N-terminal domain-containing protein n=1 Tax=Lasiosphaeria hispida TaxID=260671 RepID=A0AAJ0HR35_9PEZI|nr:SNF2 family N-terminal domain-containing protein [Lasiosphaeria hispida]
MVRTRSSLAADAGGPAAAQQPEVVVPAKRPRGRPSKAYTESLNSSSAPTPAASVSGSDYTTPLTSNVATPAPADAPQPSARRVSSRLEVHLPTVKPSARSQRALRQSIYSMDSKRKRDVIEDSEDEDADNSLDVKLARKLQAEENAASPSISQARSRKLAVRSGHTQQDLEVSIVTPSTMSTMPMEIDEITVNPAPGRPRRKSTMAIHSKKLGISEQTSIPDSQEDDDSSELSSYSDSMKSDDSESQPLSRPQRRAKLKAASATHISDDDDEPVLGDIDLPSDYSGDEADEADHAGDDEDQDGDEPDAQDTAVQAAVRSRRGYRAYRSKKRVKGDRGRLEKHHPELKTMWSDLENMPVLKAGKADQPKSISRQLKPFQREGLAWMKQMEKMKWKGGLLGDEMGLGKTIQAVSLIMSDWPAKKPSLVLVPPVALMQWVTEIESYTDGTLKTLVYHGTNSKSKNLTVKDLKKYDVIIMSYNSLESMYRKQVKGFTRKEGLFKEQSIIHQTGFHRAILDEAHCIKTRSTMTAKACFALNVTYRWCLSGTPLQNRIGEFFSLVRFLNVRPFASYICKDCPCSTLEWIQVEDNRCKDCKHGNMRHVSVFNQELLNPIQRFGNVGPGREAFKKLRVLTDRIMMRRLKKDHTDSMELPVKEINVERQFFGEEENDFASSIMTNGQRKFNTYVATGVLLNNYANIFGLIMQMRQVADHPDLILKKNSEGGQNVIVCNICDEPAEDPIRSRCKHDFCRTCAKSYLHSSEEPDCPQCHIPLSIDLEQPEIEQDEVLVKKSSIINRIKMENWTSSSKIELLVHELHKLRSNHASHKSIIFSQFTTMLQLIEWRLRRAGITTVMLDGSMTPAQRQASIEHFMTNPDVECFLVSLKAGGVALNLTEASRVFIVDPWWNPAAEWQSADRCHRIGQTRPCTITRLCIEDSVESRMVLLQEKKTNMINSTINSDDAAMDSLTPQDLQFLFRGT